MQIFPQHKTWTVRQNRIVLSEAVGIHPKQKFPDHLGSLLKAKDAGWVPPQTMGSGLIRVSTDNVGLPVGLDAPRRRELPN